MNTIHDSSSRFVPVNMNDSGYLFGQGTASSEAPISLASIYVMHSLLSKLAREAASRLALMNQASLSAPKACYVYRVAIGL